MTIILMHSCVDRNDDSPGKKSYCDLTARSSRGQYEKHKVHNHICPSVAAYHITEQWSSISSRLAIDRHP